MPLIYIPSLMRLFEIVMGGLREGADDDQSGDPPGPETELEAHGDRRGYA